MVRFRDSTFNLPCHRQELEGSQQHLYATSELLRNRCGSVWGRLEVDGEMDHWALVWVFPVF